MLENGVPAAIIGGWKKMTTMDTYARLAGVEIKGATDCLNFVPATIDYAENIVYLNNFRDGGLQ